jgi:hypothetical protein
MKWNGKLQYDEDIDEAEGRPEPETGEDEDSYKLRLGEWERQFRMTHLIINEPERFSPRKKIAAEQSNIKYLSQFPKLQVIVKLANIELTPEKPEYDGGSCHVEGQLNERYVYLNLIRSPKKLYDSKVHANVK